MTQHQMMLVDMLKWYTGICERENLRYFALGGTVLGAVRHKGFIPWDDDIDVGMPRNDYEKLLELAKTLNKDSRYVIEFPNGNREHIYPYCKIYDTKTTLVEKSRYNVKRGIYIDVFPIDGVGDTIEESRGNFRAIDKKANWLACGVCALRKGRSWYKNLCIILTRCLPRFIYDPVKIISDIDCLSKKRKYSDCAYVANFVGSWHEKEIMEKRWVEELVLCPFEDTQINIPKYYDEYLTKMYGDYMKLPPKEKRVTHHGSIYMNLEESYLN